MSIYRGSGGSGDATSDATINEVTELVQDANQYKNEAATSASNAATSASNAATSESNASTSETNASSSASDAATSEANAATSEANAASSATSASTSASNASTSATAAQTAQTAAETAQASAETAETNASASATSATNSASTATTQAGIATTKASEASASATNAATSETNAANSATSASTSATSATNSASTASTAASNAATSESNASTSETNAAASATSASSSASSASSSATSAAGSATTATTKASEASTSASNASTSETNAASSASSASTSATNAATSESNAATSATNAASSASAAATSASEAAASAVTAASFTPSQTGNAGKFLTTDGSVTSWGDVASGIEYTKHTANYTAVPKEGVIADTSGGSWTLTLPATPSEGDTVVVVDGSDWATNNLTVARNGSTIEGLTENIIHNIGGLSVSYIFDGTTWQIYTSFTTDAAPLLADAISENSIGRKNYIINGNFDIWQRGTSSVLNGSLFTYVADRWCGQEGPGVQTTSRQSFTLGQTDVPNEPRYFVRCDRTSASAVGTVFHGQRIEGVRTLAGETVTLSFYARDNLGSSTQVVNLQQNFGTGGSPSSPVTTTTSTLNLTTSWQKFEFTINLPSISGKTLGSNNDDHLFLRFVNGSGVLGTFQIDIAQVQLEKGSVATDFEYRPIAEELALCQRYFQKFGLGHSGFNASTTQVRMTGEFIVQMRDTPTLSLNDTSVSLNAPGLKTSTGSIINTTAVNNSGATYFINGFTGISAADPAISRQDYGDADAEF